MAAFAATPGRILVHDELTAFPTLTGHHLYLIIAFHTELQPFVEGTVIEHSHKL
jgi:hypothetical protein